MTIWHPKLPLTASPLHVALADALAADVERGVLAPGERLPTHRELALELSVNVGTVTRGYAEAARRGLIHGVVGRGTFVSERRGEPIPDSERNSRNGRVDLSLNLPAIPSATPERAEVLRAIGADSVDALFDGYVPAGIPAHRAAGAKWLQRGGHDATPDRVLVTSGAQHALAAAFTALLDVGRTVLCEELTYTGVRGLARALDLRLSGVAMDGEGIDPDALETACRRIKPNALYLMPAMQNPTGIVLSHERRLAVAEVARRYDVTIIEDDTYAFLDPEGPPPMSALAPERTVVATTLSKCLGAGLRTGYLLAPASDERRGASLDRLASSVAALTWMAAPLTSEIATRWIDDGTADRRAREIAHEACERRRLAETILDAAGSPSHPASTHLWLPLAHPWRGPDVVARAAERDVLILEAERFAAGRGRVPHAVRVCLGTPRHRVDLVRGLEAIASVLGDEAAAPAIA